MWKNFAKTSVSQTSLQKPLFYHISVKGGEEMLVSSSLECFRNPIRKTIWNWAGSKEISSCRKSRARCSFRKCVQPAQLWSIISVFWQKWVCAAPDIVAQQLCTFKHCINPTLQQISFLNHYSPPSGLVELDSRSEWMIASSRRLFYNPIWTNGSVRTCSSSQPATLFC